MIDMDHIILEFINLFRTGIFAGIEFMVCFGVRAPLNVLDEQPQIQIRLVAIPAAQTCFLGMRPCPIGLSTCTWGAMYP
jgi:hypothetical protein